MMRLHAMTAARSDTRRRFQFRPGRSARGGEGGPPASSERNGSRSSFATSKQSQREGKMRSVWTPEQTAEIIELRAQGKRIKEIAQLVGRTSSSVESQLAARRRKAGEPPRSNGGRPPGPSAHTIGRRIAPDPRALAECAYRLSLAPRDLTAAICGDPLPGFSALDRRNPFSSLSCFAREPGRVPGRRIRCRRSPR